LNLGDRCRLVARRQYGMKPEEKARNEIDRLLDSAGWTLEDYPDFNLSAAQGVAVREFPLASGTPDYLLFVDGRAVGVVEAKSQGTTLSGVAEQTCKYLTDLPANLPRVASSLPFAYESTGIETFFRDERDPDPRSRRLFAFHEPATLAEWAAGERTLRHRLKGLPALNTEGLWRCQTEAIRNLEESFAAGHPRALIQMATGSGKTYTAVSFVYRLVKFAGARRILFLVDRSNLGRQTKKEFQQYITPDDGRKFTELYNVQHLTSNTLDPVSRVCISTIQRIYSMLKGEPELDAELEEGSMFDLSPAEEKPREVGYNPRIPIETFDFIITDECHRSIYNQWRQVLEYFDAFIIGLTATPSKQTIGFFNQNLVMEYSHERAVADGVNVGYEVYRIRTAISERGSHVDAGYFIDKRDKLTRKTRWEQLDDDLDYEPAALDRKVVAPSQIRTIIRTFKERLFTEIFPGRTEVPKTLVFAKDDSHAEDIVQIIRDEFGKGNEFCKKITYRTTGEKPEDLIASFRNSYNPRIAVTVDMISTGTDIKPLECLLFMRDVRSRVYFEQMKGRGTRTISPTDLKAVTPDTDHKSEYVIVDAVGVCEKDKTDSRPLERKRGVPFEKLLLSVALGNRDGDTLSSLAGRLARLDQGLSERDKDEICRAAGEKPVAVLVNSLLDSIDPDKQEEEAKRLFKTEEPTEEQVAEARDRLAESACAPFDDAALRNTILEIKKRNEQIIDTVSIDELIDAGFAEEAKEKARTIVGTFKKFIEENKDELTALQIIYGKPRKTRHITFEEIRRLANKLSMPPYSITHEQVWLAYEQLQRAKVRRAGPQKLLTNIISLVRFAVGAADALVPYPETVNERFEHWLAAQEQGGRALTAEQREWLEMIRDHIAASVSIGVEDFDYAPFYERGGATRAHQVFGEKLTDILEELNEVLVA